MSYIRIGDIFDGGRDAEDSYYELADKLAQRVLATSTPPELVFDYYIQSLPKFPVPASLHEIVPETEFGEYEIKILTKQPNAPKPVLCIVGPMGCGKTMFKDYLLGRIKAAPASSRYGARRLIAHLDLNYHEKTLNDLANHDSKQELSAELYQTLSKSLRGRLNATGWITEEEELTTFWDYMHNLVTNDFYPTKSFDAIFAACGPYKPNAALSGDQFASEMERRKTERDRVLSKSELNLDYLAQLWKYVHTKYLSDGRGIAIVLIDNADGLEPPVQRELVQVLLSAVKEDGPLFLLLLRPETFDFLGFSTRVIDVETHQHPDPYEVVLDRLHRFCDDEANSYYDENDGLTMPQYEQIKTFVGRILAGIENRRNDNFAQFIRYACPDSIRSALLIAQGLFKVPVSDMENADFPPHDLIRVCITRGRSQLRWKPNYPVSHLFRMAAFSDDTLLLKPRILQYLNVDAGQAKTAGEVISTLSAFGYPPQQIVQAITELNYKYCQSVRSNGSNYMVHQEILHYQAESHRVKITPLGINYVTYLMFDIDYLQEVMLDSYVQSSYFPISGRLRHISDKLILLKQFLNELRREDIRSTTKFISTFGAGGYRTIFGANLISLDIINRVYRPTRNILYKLATDNPRFSSVFESVQEDFRSLLLQLADDNKHLIGMWVSTVIDEGA